MHVSTLQSAVHLLRMGFHIRFPLPGVECEPGVEFLDFHNICQGESYPEDLLLFLKSSYIPYEPQLRGSLETILIFKVLSSTITW